MSETREQIDARIQERFSIMEDFTYACTTGDCRSLIVSGPGGLGKSYTAEKVMAKWDPTGTQYTISKGYCLTTGLLRLLYTHRFPNHVVIFDDSDSIFANENSLNLLKTVCDTTERRTVSYRTESRKIDEDSADLIPTSFDFDASVIFLTNVDFDRLIEKESTMSPHYEALVTRSHYIDLTIKTRQEKLVRIEQVVKEGLLNKFPVATHKDIVGYLHQRSDQLRELSLRMALKVGMIRNMGKPNWKNIADVTCCKL